MASDCANNVVVSSIPPVLNNVDRQERADCINAALVDLCSETGAEFRAVKTSFDWQTTQSTTCFCTTMVSI